MAGILYLKGLIKKGKHVCHKITEELKRVREQSVKYTNVNNRHYGGRLCIQIDMADNDDVRLAYDVMALCNDRVIEWELATKTSEIQDKHRAIYFIHLGAICKDLYESQGINITPLRLHELAMKDDLGEEVVCEITGEIYVKKFSVGKHSGTSIAQHTAAMKKIEAVLIENDIAVPSRLSDELKSEEKERSIANGVHHDMPTYNPKRNKRVIDKEVKSQNQLKLHKDHAAKFPI